MKLVKSSVRMYERYANDALYEIWVEGLPALEEMRYEKRGSLYYAEKDGYVVFYAYSGPGDGYGGRTFNITLTDGTPLALKGPWSSRAGEMMKAGFPETVEVVIDGIISGAVTREWLTKNGLETVGLDVGYGGTREVLYVPAKNGVPLKNVMKREVLPDTVQIPNT
jgi:hypothetical protein